MYQNTTAGPDEQEIKLADVSKRIGGFFERISRSFFNFLFFVKKNIIALSILFIVGAVIGVLLDKSAKMYENRIIVTPNFGSVDYLYSKIDLVNAKILEGDTLFLKNEVGLKAPKKMGKITIDPISDIYKFVEKPQNFELVKLMAEDGDVQKIIKEDATAKNYSYHLISFVTKGKTTNEATISPLLQYLNKSPYFEQMKGIVVKNTLSKMNQNDSIIRQIDKFLKLSANTANGQSKSSNLVYYNENTQLNDIIRTKQELIGENNYHRVELINFDKIVKDSSIISNIRDKTGLNSKMKFIMPILFVSLFFLFVWTRNFYRRNKGKMA